jgi:hypothetical protein
MHKREVIHGLKLNYEHKHSNQFIFTLIWRFLSVAVEIFYTNLKE